jgi:sugar/nucleoside kinase (ribokinase family)
LARGGRHAGDLAGRAGRGDHAHHVAVLARGGVRAVLGADERLPAGTIVTMVAPDGERSFLTDSGANANLDRADLPHPLLDGVDLVCLSGYSFFAEQPRAAVRALLVEIRRRSIPFVVDASSYSFLQEAGPRNFLEWTTGARICFANAEEATVLADSDDLDEQLRVLCMGYQLVVIKRGTEAAIAAEAGTGRRWSVPVPEVEAIDSSGGGDAFLAGFLSRWLNGAEVKACLERAVALGARAVTQWGGRPQKERRLDPL